MFHMMAFVREAPRPARRQILSRFPAKTKKPAASKPVERRRTTRIGTFRVQILEHNIPLRGGREIARVNLLRGSSFRWNNWIGFFASRLGRFELRNRLAQPANQSAFQFRLRRTALV